VKNYHEAKALERVFMTVCGYTQKVAVICSASSAFISHALQDLNIMYTTYILRNANLVFLVKVMMPPRVTSNLVENWGIVVGSRTRQPLVKKPCIYSRN